MQTLRQVIDAHVHLYTEQDLSRISEALPYALPEPHPLKPYLDQLIDMGLRPRLINNVHLSILPDSENVFASFKELDALQQQNPQRYGAITLVGTLLADPAYATSKRMNHPQVKGLRIVLHDAKPEEIEPALYRSAEWSCMLGRLREDQHLHIYAQDPRVNYLVLKQLPKDINVILDHLGTCQPELGTTQSPYVELLDEAARRGNVWFKGPGYRTSTDPAMVAMYVRTITEKLGANKLLLEASDAPHVGKDQSGVPFTDHFTAYTALQFVAHVANEATAETDVEASALLKNACDAIFTPHKEKD
ncbi:amidohydrolase family protein [Polycladidibacter hongkongensis]|uniref:amidohydrolase family protein n=1 Tax=Polycladidibacter hongkongensis TaxID=1647556 RepID=UPI00082A4F47|nr:amidohydrolase family protein [Pseudovibrio hongkongensis]